MILIDDRAGSQELIEPLRTVGYQVQADRMEFGDIAFHGNGPDGPVFIGIEYKKMNDLLQCMADDRLMGHQIPGMLEMYDKSYLAIEGAPMLQSDGGFKNYESRQHRWRRPHGARLSIRRLLSYLINVEEHGVRLMLLPSQMSVCAWVGALYSWWQKDWDKHQSMFIHEKPLSLIVPSLRQKMAYLLPHIGHGKLNAINEYFPSVRAMINAEPHEWRLIKGIGEKTIDAIQEALDED